MKRLLGVLLVVSAGAAALASALRRTKRIDVAGPPAKERTEMQAETVGQSVERIHEGDLPAATGRNEEHDVLGATHTLTPDEAQQIRAHQRLMRGGKATSSAREGMFDDAVPGGDVGEAGSMGDERGREDHNPIGPRK